LKINPVMLILARESRGYTQGQLSKKIGIGQAALSKYENGILEIAPEYLQVIASALEYPQSLFIRSATTLGFGSTCMYHRKRQTLSVNELKRIQAKVNLTRMNIEILLRSAELEADYPFPNFDVAEYGDVEEIAYLTRRTWHVPLGPITNLVDTIERAGGIVIPMSFGNRKLDAISQWPPGMPPLFFINSDMPWERIRFSLAHELGHLIMHRIPSPEQEEEADTFASSFLMPESEIRPDLYSLNLMRAAQLKSYWRVSMQALIRRAYNIGQLTESQYRRLFTQVSKHGWRLSEPNPLSSENPSSFWALTNVHLEQHRYTIAALSELLTLSEQEFKADYLPRFNGPIRIVS